jgi:uncharacterized protein YlxP (DUF503 family)
MFVGVLTVPIYLSGIGSLKDKRRIVKSLVERLRGRFNVSASEVGAMDNRQMAVIAVAVVANDGGFVEQQLDTIDHFIRNDGRFYPGQVKRELFPAGRDMNIL